MPASRAFPARPLAGGPSTPFRSTQAQGRSTEAPMEYEYSTGRREMLGASPFVAATSGGDGEPARKRTHYEAMDVDTPPRLSTGASFPASATATSNPYGFGASSQDQAPPPPPHPLSFDASSFKPEQAFGLENEVQTEEISMADEAEELIREIREEDAAMGEEEKALTVRGEARRRRPSSRKSKERSSSAGTDGDETASEDGGGEGESGGFLNVLKNKVGRRAGDGQFSFQVHHHHAPVAYGGAGAGGVTLGGGTAGEGQVAAPEKWLKSGTPYVLLGYLQFGSLTLLAVLVLSLLLLFLYTLYNDIITRLSSLTLELRAEILQCAKSYVDNRCAPETRLPAMESRCAAWEECMNREVVVGGKTRVVAETLAEVVNGFVDVISFKTMLFVLLTLALTIYGSSVALSILPSRPSHPPPASPSAHPAPHFGYPHAVGAAPGYPPYGLPYAPGPGWVVEQNGHEGAVGRGGKETLRVGAPGS
ncbi:hypothetical protein JCM11251_001579 [Rhodosporidiobolus azoricus]